eukprot:CAMPEP_0201911406 /NCGR_PEP_ID=MMETSP0903-20130614/2350_1 /ASSEMBLY_ACC=CAM_ASM_000552 /TAXON_ID=420261 /ORGANISM="Thalassiosira antarctica, Strain CCMP982" /LENGTH=87 /DNA_ID=CAMNT_0048446109 /DNA_START=150 /DNA_END=410 /DNA_ORIENTATION=+
MAIDEYEIALAMNTSVQKEHLCESTVPAEPSQATRWGTDHDEAKRASINQKDLEVTFSRLITPGGIDKDIYKVNRDNLDTVLPTDRD